MTSKSLLFILTGILFALAAAPARVRASNFNEHMKNAHDLLAKNDFEHAVPEYQKAFKSKPKSVEARSGLGVAYEKWGDSLLQSGETGRAIEAYQNAVATLPDEPSWHEHLGLAMEKNGDPESACKEFRVAAFLFSPVDGRHAPDRNPVAVRPDLEERGCKLATLEEHIGNAKHFVTAPIPTYQGTPNYTGQARHAKLQGTVVLWCLIDPSGDVTATKIVEPLGLGLDEEAIKAVRNWKFKPAMSDGTPVAVKVKVEVAFRLY